MSAAPDKWRPSLTLVIFTVLATVGVLPLVGLFFFRLYDNQLIRQTQAELIAQSRVLATIYAQEVTARLDSGLTLGAEVPPNVLPDPATRSPRSALRSTSPPMICCGGDPRRWPRPSRRSPLISRSAQD
jgi:two-component system, OmpR family, sensor histidine kinase CreC